jgi:hypothetical protein
MSCLSASGRICMVRQGDHCNLIGAWVNHYVMLTRKFVFCDYRPIWTKKNDFKGEMFNPDSGWNNSEDTHVPLLAVLSIVSVGCAVIAILTTGCPCYKTLFSFFLVLRQNELVFVPNKQGILNGEVSVYC